MTEIPAPRETADLVGHTEAEKQLIEAWSSGRLPHGWLINGPRGIGKATLAYRFARFLLANGQSPDTESGPSMFGDELPVQIDSLAVDPENPVFKRVASGGHADLQVIERRMTDDGKRMQSVIPVDSVRVAGRGMSLTAGEGGWRVVIVDGVEEMNVNASNALLKMLEEPPPNTVLLLVTHAPGRLLPTIKSRCCQLRLAPLSSEEVSTLLTLHDPDIDEKEKAVLVGIADGSIGRALSLAENGGLEVRQDLVKLLASLPNLDMAAAHRFSDKLARRDADTLWRTAVDLTNRSLSDLVGASARRVDLQTRGYSQREADQLRHLQDPANLDRWVEVWEKTSRLFAQADSANLDRKQVMLSALGTMETAARTGV